MFRYVIFDILLSSRKFPLFRTRFAEFKTFFLYILRIHFYIFFSPISSNILFLRSKTSKDTSQSRFGRRILPILTLYHRRVPGDVTSRANSRGSYGNGAANTKPKSIRCTRQHIARGARWALVVPEVGDGRTEREREREIHIGSKDTRDEGKTDRDRNIYTWNVSGYGAVCKCYDPLLCSSSLFVAVLPPRLTRSTMAPMGPREFCLLAFSRWRSAAGEKIENFESFRKFVLDSRSRRICFFFEEKKWQDPSHASIHRTWIIGWQGRITSFVNGLNTRPRQLCWIIEDRYLLSLHNNASTWISSLTLTNCLIHARVFLSDRRIILTNFRKQGENWLSFAIFRSISNRTGTIFSTGKRS